MRNKYYRLFAPLCRVDNATQYFHSGYTKKANCLGFRGDILGYGGGQGGKDAIGCQHRQKRKTKSLFSSDFLYIFSCCAAFLCSFPHFCTLSSRQAAFRQPDISAKKIENFRLIAIDMPCQMSLSRAEWEMGWHSGWICLRFGFCANK